MTGRQAVDGRHTGADDAVLAPAIAATGLLAFGG